MALAERFEKELGKRFSFAEEHQLGRRGLTQAAADSLYACMGWESPAIVWCQSPYQLATLPSLLIGIFFSDAWQIASGLLLDRAIDEAWEADFNEIWEQLWIHGGQQLLNGMRHTSRVGTQYEHLENALIAQLKSELSSWAKSGKLASFENKLPKEIIYRQFWAMRLWHLNPVQDRLKQLSAELAEEFDPRKSYWELHQKQLDQFLPYKAKLEETFTSCSNTLSSLVARMGAEPSHQLKHCTWLPMSIVWPSLAQIWRQEVDEKAFDNYSNEIDAWNHLAENVLAAICFEHVMFVCEKPLQFNIDDAGRFHGAEGPCLEFNDEFMEFAWHGVIVDEWIITNPDSITIDHIDKCPNAETRRVLIEKYGQFRYLQDTGAEEVQSDSFGTLYKKEIPGDEDLVMVKVVNSSPEPDGTFKDYFLRVPPDMQTAQQAIAWTFGFDEEEYQPLIET